MKKELNRRSVPIPMVKLLRHQVDFREDKIRRSVELKNHINTNTLRFSDNFVKTT